MLDELDDVVGGAVFGVKGEEVGVDGGDGGAADSVVFESGFVDELASAFATRHFRGWVFEGAAAAGGAHGLAVFLVGEDFLDALSDGGRIFGSEI